MRTLLLVSSFLSLAACGGSSPADMGTGTDSGAFSSLPPCGAMSDYVAGPTTVTAGVGGFVYAPKCLRVPAGTVVTLPGSATHPLRRSTRGTAGSPIPDGPSTSAQVITFSSPGFYPYYCNVHGNDSGTTMSGVVWVE